MTKLYCLGGLPRAGSTLLCNILAQNPQIHATHTSGMMDVMFGVRNQWECLVEHQAHPDENAQRRVLRAIPEAYYADIEKPIVIDKCRGWLSLIEMYEWVFGEKIKIIVPVRDLRDVLASFEKLWRRQAATGLTQAERHNYFESQTVEGRCEFLCRNDQPVGLACNRIKGALQRGFADRMHFVDFDDLTRDPAQALRGVYAFLGVTSFTHDFANVEQVTIENDDVHGMGDLHKIRPVIQASEPQWPTILGPAADKYEAKFWRNGVQQ